MSGFFILQVKFYFYAEPCLVSYPKVFIDVVFYTIAYLYFYLPANHFVIDCIFDIQCSSVVHYYTYRSAGQYFTLEDEDGKPTIKKTGKEIMGKVEGGEKVEVEYKLGDNVIYKRGKFNEESWKKITDDDKKKPNEGPMKDLQDKEEIGIKAIKSDVKEPKNPEGKVEFEGYEKKV